MASVTPLGTPLFRDSVETIVGIKRPKLPVIPGSQQWRITRTWHGITMISLTRWEVIYGQCNNARGSAHLHAGGRLLNFKAPDSCNYIYVVWIVPTPTECTYIYVTKGILGPTAKYTNFRPRNKDKWHHLYVAMMKQCLTLVHLLPLVL